jgi:hypothetical protein
LRTNCLLKHVIEGKLEEMIEMTGRRGWRRKQLLDGLKETRGYKKLKQEAQDRTVWTTRFGRGYGPVLRQTAEWMNLEIQIFRITGQNGCSALCTVGGLLNATAVGNTGTTCYWLLFLLQTGPYHYTVWLHKEPVTMQCHKSGCLLRKQRTKGRPLYQIMIMIVSCPATRANAVMN